MSKRTDPVAKTRADVRALVAWVRMYVKQEGFVTLEEREQARVILEPFKGVKSA